MGRNNLVRQGLIGLVALGSCLSLGVAQSPNREATPPTSRAWIADNGDGTFKNPVIHADYSDPDVIRVGDDFYMTASSFNAVPGLPILHSKDLVNWQLVAHVFKRQPPFDVYNSPRHGNGVWAPSIRHHQGQFFIYYSDPDFGIYLVKASSPRGPWSEPLLIKQAKGWIDPCPLWDADGRAYLISAMAASRSGVKSILVLSRMSPDGSKILDDGALIFDGHDQHPTVEGPKLYVRNGYYYIFAPAGGVEAGWQLVLRSKSIYGPYETRTVLAQGKTAVNGPHQGGWVETQSGEHWFIHFQDKGPYGRVVHLQPMKWNADWPVIGSDPDGDGTGEPVSTYRKPNVNRVWSIVTPPDSDEFDSNTIGPQWQWHANSQPNWAFPARNLGVLRIFNVPPPDGYRNFWDVPNLLLQKFPAPEFTVTTKLTFTPRTDHEETGLLVMGLDYAYVSVAQKPEGLFISQVVVREAESGTKGKQSATVPAKGNTFYLRLTVSKGAVCTFDYSTDGTRFAAIGEPFTARKGKWIGAKVGLFAIGPGKNGEMGYVDIDWFRVE